VAPGGNGEVRLKLLNGGNDVAKRQIGVEPYRLCDEEERQQQPQHNRVFDQGLAVFGAKEFSAEAVNIEFFH
jgi:hypothetical protein